MRILVTGGNGFIGKHLIKNLQKKGHSIICLDKDPIRKEEKLDNIEYIEAHTKDIFNLNIKCDIIYHLGEYSRISTSFEDIEDVWESNVIGTFSILEFCKEKNIKLIYAGSSSKFGNGGEDENLSPYAWTKSKNVELIKNYALWFKLNYSIAYFYNVYGPGHTTAGKYSTVIGIFEEQFKKRKPLTVVKPGTQKRYFTHIGDVVRGLLELLNKGDRGEFSFGDDKSLYSVEEVARMFSNNITYINSKKGDRKKSPIDLLSSANILGWTPKIHLKDYIKDYKKQWYNHNTERENL